MEERTSNWKAWLIAPVVALAAFMEVLDISIANVSLEHIAGNLSASRDQSTWVLTSYLVTNAIVLPMSGWLSRRIGRKRFFMGCIVGFSLSSLLCGLAPSLDALILFRALQGATGGGLQPTSQAILADSFPPRQRGTAFAFYGVAVVFAPALGPALGGWITQNWSWRWVFFLNLPVGIVLLFLIATMLPGSARRRRADASDSRPLERIDYLGFGLLALGMGCLQIFLDRGQRYDWFDSHFVTALAVISTSSFIAFVIWELRHDHPIVDLRLFRVPGFAVSNVLMFALGIALFGSTALLPLYVQSLLGFTATDAGLVIMPGGFATMLLMPLAGRLTDRVDLRWLIIFGLLIGALGLYRMSGFNTQTDFWTVALTRLILSVALPFLFLPITTAGYIGIPQAKNNEASALINMSRNVGGSVGISILTSVLARRSQFHHNRLVGNFTDFNPAYSSAVQGLAEQFRHSVGATGNALAHAQAVLYRALQQQASMLAYIDDFRLLSIMFLAAVPLVFFLRRRRGTVHEAGD